MKDAKLYKDIKDILKWYLSRYSYIIWVSFIVRALGASFFGSLLIILILAVLITWRDKQFLDEDGYEMVFSVEKNIGDQLMRVGDNLKRIYEKFTNIR